MELKKSFSRHLKLVFILGELLFLTISFFFTSYYITLKEEKKFIDAASHSTDLVNLYTSSKTRVDDYKSILNRTVTGTVSYRGLLKAIDADNTNNRFKNSVYLYTKGEGFYPKLPKGFQGKLDFWKKYINEPIYIDGQLNIINSIERGNYTLFLSYGITEDPILKKNINATKLDGYVCTGDSCDISWTLPTSDIENRFYKDEYVSLKDYSLGPKEQLVLVPNNIGIDSFSYLINDREYVRTVFIENMIVGGFFFLKFLLTIVFTLVTTRKFSKALNSLVRDCMNLAKGKTDRNKLKNKYEFKEFRSLLSTISTVWDKKGEIEEKLRQANDGMEETVRSRTMELSKAIKKAEAASMEKMNFLAQISHEIRTPMNCIIGFCEIMLNRDDPRNSSQLATKIIEETETLLRLINDILDDSKIENGKMKLKIDRVDVSDFIDRIIELGNPYQGEKDHNITINKTIDSDVPKYIGVDELRLYQVISNLYFNGMKYTDRGSVNIEVKRSGNRVLFSISDTGIGIPENRIHTIFEDYERLHGNLSRRYRGTGLGLTITKKIVSLMGGEIFVESKIGQGSRFTVILPYAPMDQRCPENKSLEMNSEEKSWGNILLVEDYPTNRIVARSHLETTGYTVYEAENGEEAIKIIDTIRFDLILMDIQMPVMDGFKATELIRSGTSINSESPIVAMTANGLKSIEERCKEVGMNGIILKPIRRKTFLSYIKNAMKEGSLA